MLSEICAQLVWTLRPADDQHRRRSASTASRSTVARRPGRSRPSRTGRPFDPDAVPVDAVGHYLSGGALHTVTAGDPAPGPAGTGVYGLASAAVSADPAHRRAVVPRRRPDRRRRRDAVRRPVRRRAGPGAHRRDAERADASPPPGRRPGWCATAPTVVRVPAGGRPAGGERAHAAPGSGGPTSCSCRRTACGRRWSWTGPAGRSLYVGHRRPRRGRRRRAARPAAPSRRRSSQVVDVAWRDSGSLLVLAGDARRGPDRALRGRRRRLGSDRPSRRRACPASPSPIAAAPTRQPLVDAGGTIWQLAGGTWVDAGPRRRAAARDGALLPALSSHRSARRAAGRDRPREPDRRSSGRVAAVAAARWPTWCCRAPAPAAACPGRSSARGAPRLLAGPRLGRARAGSRGASRRRPPPGAYAGPVRPAVNAFKERGPRRAGRAAGRGAGARRRRGRRGAAAAPRARSLLVPVPSSRRRCARRGRDHVRELTAAGGAPSCAPRGCLPRSGSPLLRRRGRVPGLRRALGRSSGAPTWPARSRSPRTRAAVDGAAGPRRRRRHQRRDAHRGRIGSFAGLVPSGESAGARRGRPPDPGAASGLIARRDPKKNPQRSWDPSGGAPLIDCRERGGEGLASKRPNAGFSPGGLMEIVVRGRNVEVPEHYRQHVEDKVGQLERFDGKLEDAPHGRGAVPREESPPVRALPARGDHPPRQGPGRPGRGRRRRLLRRPRPRLLQARQRACAGRPTAAACTTAGGPRPACGSPNNTGVRRGRHRRHRPRPAARRGHARHRSGRAPARSDRPGEAPSRDAHDRRPGPPRDGAGRPRLLPVPVRRHRASRPSSTAGTPTTTASSG